jgi:hypothetical protein
MKKTHYVRECLLKHPYLIPKLLKNKNYNPKITKGILYNMIPLRSSIEIECITSLSNVLKRNFNTMQKRYDIFEYSDDKREIKSNKICEHRISILNYSQALGLYKILEDMKKYCKLNMRSGIHIHINASNIINIDYLKDSTKYFIINDYLTDQLDKLEQIFGEYKGRHNRKLVNIEQKNSWINIRYRQFNTIEFRIAPMTFEYETIIKWIIECNKIVKQLHFELKVPY